MHLELETTVPGLMLRQLTESDAAHVYGLVQRNIAHLTALGDYSEIVSMSLDEVLSEIHHCPPSSLQLGLFLNGELVGRVDLNSPKPGTCVLGYWIDAAHTGRGFVQAAGWVVVAYVRDVLKANDMWAGVKSTNLASVAVLERLGFELVETLPTHLRFRLLLRQLSSS
jgi:[ribosomal protein S5]-alanine N-acetyltransferase